MNIFGEGFPQEIIDQIEIRQKVYGYGYGENTFNRFEGSYVYTNAKTAWCKLVSAATINDTSLLNNSIIRDLGFTNGDQIARDFILFNGTAMSSSLDGKFGLGYGDTKGFGAYNSWGIPSADFGFRPMAGITSVTVKHKNRGSIRAATVNIKAWDKATFEIIDVLYLRLGFSILLEWGNSIYLENKNATLQQNVNNSLSNDFLEAKISYTEFLKKIKDQQLKSFGNYDAMFGKVTNFHWSFNQDGSYDITLDLISAGDVLESFKIKGNALATSDTSTTSTGTETDKPVNLDTKDIYKVLAKYAPTNDIANYLYKASLIFQTDHQGHDSGINYLYNYSAKTDPNNYWTPTTGDFDKAKASPYRKKDICFVVSTTTTSSYDNSTKYDAETNYFIRLGNLIKFIQEGVMYKVKNQKGAEQPLLLFDYDFDNFMHVPPQMMSYDPSICMVRRKVTFPGTPGNPNKVDEAEYFQYSGYIDQSSVTRTNFAEEFMVNGLDEVGKIMNIYINFRYILTKLQESTDKDSNELKLIDFLKSILSGINSAFGGYSKLELFIDETTNEVKIIDQNPLPSNIKAIEYLNTNYKKSIPTKYALFELYGYVKRENVDYEKTTIVQDFKFNTEITPEFATMISVAATSQGNVVGENNTALSKLNLGLTDKYKTEINGGGALLNSQAQDKKTKLQEDKSKAEYEYYEFVNNLVGYLEHLFYGTYIPQEIQDNKGAFTIYLNLYKKVQKAINDYNSYDSTTNSFKNITKFQPGTGFIPFNLSLTIDGLSGVKIGSKFLVDGTYLPSNYPETVDFLIKNITHEIKDNKWTTNLESYCIAQGDSAYTTPRRESAPSSDKKPKSDSKVNPNRDKNTNIKNRGDFFSWVRGPYAAPDNNFSENGYAVAVLKGKVIDKFTKKASKNPPVLSPGYPKTVDSSKGNKITTEKYETVDYTSAEFEKQLQDILKGIGAASTSGNIIFMKAWRQAEGGSALNNPWNSTQKIGTKLSNYNYVGVKNYFTYQDGVDATIKTITNGYYNTVLKALRKGLKDKAEALELARLVQKYDMTGAIPDKWK